MKKFTSFSRHVERVWLEYTLSAVAHGAEPALLNYELEQLLQTSVATAENRRKARNLLVSIWGQRANTIHEKFDCEALELFRKTEQSSLMLQWGMLVARKPFFAAVARFIGRYCKLNESVQYAQVNKRMCELFGETESTSRATRAVLKTMQELGALTKGDNGGLYPAEKLGLSEPNYINWMLKGMLISDSVRSRAFEEALQDPAWFPFVFSINISQIDTQSFELHQQGNSLYLFLKQEVE